MAARDGPRFRREVFGARTCLRREGLLGIKFIGYRQSSHRCYLLAGLLGVVLQVFGGDPYDAWFVILASSLEPEIPRTEAKKGERHDLIISGVEATMHLTTEK